MNNLVQRLRDNADIDEAEGCTASVVALEREAADRIAQLEADLAEAKKDQARYQWLDSISSDEWKSLHQISGELLNSYIDAAIAIKEQQ